MDGAAGATDETTIVRQVWWKRAGIWVGGAIALQGGLGLLHFTTSPGAWFASAMLCVGVILGVVGWRQGVKVTDDGIETLRLARREDRTARWGDIERFESNRAVLHDATSIMLFDWRGYGDAVQSRLEAERRARQTDAEE